MEPAVKTESRVEEVNQAENCKDQAKIRKFPDQLGVTWSTFIWERYTEYNEVDGCQGEAALPLKKKFTPISKYWGSPAQQPMILLTWNFGSRPKIDFYDNLIV